MTTRRIQRLNSLLKEVISEVVFNEVKNPHLPRLVTITQVSVTADLYHAKVYVSVIGTPEVKQEALKALQSAAGFIAINASKKIRIRYFPQLTFYLDEGVDKQMKIEQLLEDAKPHHE